MSLPINHLKRTLDRCCGQWEFRYYDSSRFEVEFLNTHSNYVIFYDDGKWEANLFDDEFDSRLCPRLTGILNGHTRSESGEMVEVSR